MLWRGAELNCRPRAYETPALPLSYPANVRGGLSDRRARHKPRRPLPAGGEPTGGESLRSSNSRSAEAKTTINARRGQTIDNCRELTHYQLVQVAVHRGQDWVRRSGAYGLIRIT